MALYDDEAFFGNYAQMARSRGGLEAAGEWPQFSALLPQDMSGLDVLDLGCGYGWHCRYAAQRGARSVLGIDPSARMLARAAELGGEGVEYRLCAVEEFIWPEARFDLVISNLALHYVEDLDAVFRGVYRALRPGGAFALNIEHPSFTAGVHEDWYRDAQGSILHFPVDHYFCEGARQAVFLGERMTKYHRTLTSYVGALLENGFALTGLAEPQPTQQMIDTIPGMADEMRRPMMLILRGEKQ